MCDTDKTGAAATRTTPKTTSANFTDEEFQAWLLDELKSENQALYEEYPAVFEAATVAIVKWRQRFHGNRAVWKRMFDKKSVMKEFVEACPIIHAVQRLVANASIAQDSEKFTIVDLASGKGYLSMLLSEMLPPSKVKRFVLMDKAWASHGTVTPSAHHMNWDHLYDPKYKASWPIPLIASKQDLKSKRQRKNLQQHYFENGDKVILLAVHLCGTLALHAVNFFNHNLAIQFFALKPCCLPGMIFAKRKEVFMLSDLQQYKHCFPAASVCLHGKWNKNKWKGPHRAGMELYFQTWAHNLFLGIAATAKVVDNEDGSREREKASGDADDDDDDGNNSNITAQHHNHNLNIGEPTTATLSAQKIQQKIMVQTNGGFQNEFLFAQRAATTNFLTRNSPIVAVAVDQEESLQQGPVVAVPEQQPSKRQRLNEGK